MTNVDMVHSSRTALADPTSGSVGLAGASWDEDNNWYEAFNFEEMDAVMQSGRKFVFGTDKETIEYQLRDRHPPKHPDCTNLFFEALQHREYDYEKGRYVEYEKHVWHVLKWPAYFMSTDVNDIRSISVAVGCVLIKRTDLSKFTEADFTASRYRLGGNKYGNRMETLMRVRYSPGTIARRPYFEAKKKYEQRIAGKLPKSVSNFIMHELMDWPHWHPAKKLGKPISTTYRSGYSHMMLVEFSMTQLLDAKDMLLKLDKRKFWRGESATSEGNRMEIRGEWTDAVRPALDYVHAIEEYARKRLEEFGDRKDTHAYREFSDHLRFCRWMRAEARALGIKMPRKPVKPLTPAQQAKKKKRKRKRRKKTCRSS